MDIGELTKEQRQETVEHVIEEVRRFSGLLDKEYYELEVRKYCVTNFKRNPGKKYASLII